MRVEIEKTPRRDPARDRERRQRVGRSNGSKFFLEAQALLAELDPTVNEHTRRAIQYVADFYTAWNAAEPTAERAAKAEEWEQRVEDADGR